MNMGLFYVQKTVVFRYINYKFKLIKHLGYSI